jgi:hypothetical protein
MIDAPLIGNTDKYIRPQGVEDNSRHWLQPMHKGDGMSRRGYLVFFTVRKSGDVRAALGQVLAKTGAVSADTVFRSKAESHEWQDLLANPGEVDEGEDEEVIAESIMTRDVPALYVEGTCLCVLLAQCDLGRRIDEALINGIDAALRGGSFLVEVAVRFGEHDLFESLENQEGHYFGRAFFSISISGYGIPEDCNEYRDRVLTLAEVSTVKTNLEEVLGPLEVCLYWM